MLEEKHPTQKPIERTTYQEMKTINFILLTTMVICFSIPTTLLQGAISEESTSILNEIKQRQSLNEPTVNTAEEKNVEVEIERKEGNLTVTVSTSEADKTPAIQSTPEAEPELDVIVLVNGDRISGKVVDIFNETLTISAYGNEAVSIPFGKITSINTTDEYKITLNEGTVLEGRFNGVSDEKTMVITEVGTVMVKNEQVVSADNLPAVARKEAEVQEALTFNLDKVWDGRAGLGLVETTGNSEAKALSLDFEATRKSPQDKLFLDAHYNKNTADGVTSSDFIRGGARIDIFLKNKCFYFLVGRMEIDKLQALDLRTTIGAGLGKTFYDHDTGRLDMGLGMTYERENYEAQPTESDRTLLYSLNFDKKLNHTMSFTERLMVFPSIDELSDYRIESNAGFHYALTDTFGLNFGFLYRYDKTPQTGSKRNDATVTTSITQKF